MPPEAVPFFSAKQMLIAFGAVMITTIGGALYLFYMLWKGKKEQRERESKS